MITDSIRLFVLCALLTGCGLAQTVGDGAASTANALLHKQLKTLELDFIARASLNTDTQDARSLSASTVVRVYQLRRNDGVERASYDSLLNDSVEVLNDDLLVEHSVLVRPGEAAQLSVALHPQAQAIAVVGLFREPDAQDHSWRLVIARDELLVDQARVIELRENRLRLWM
jgi:type VI secretion system protein VasD